MPRPKAADSTGAQVVDAASVILSGLLVDVRVVQVVTLERVAVPWFCRSGHTFSGTRSSPSHHVMAR
jgi:hypothetical protein